MLLARRRSFPQAEFPVAPDAESHRAPSVGTRDAALLAGLVLAAALLHLWLTGTTLLSGDEAYYWLWSRRLQLSYYDHPAMMAWWMAGATALFGESEAAIRLPAVLSVAAVTGLAFDTARLAFRDIRAGWWAVAVLNATLLFAAAGVLVTPDSPLLVFWSLSLWAMVRLLDDGRARWLYLLGLSLGLGFCSKYTMVLIAPGIMAVFALFPQARRWLKSPHFWAAIVLALACTSPVLIWNAQHDWISIKKQLSHSFDAPVSDPLKSLATFVGTQLGVITPLIFGFMLWGMGWTLWAGWRSRQPAWFLLGATSAPLLAFFVRHSLGGVVQPHWPGPAYLGAAIATSGAWVVLAPSWRRLRWLWHGAIALGGLLVAATYVQMETARLPIPLKSDPMSRLGGWDQLASAVEAERTRHPDAFVFTTKHEVAGLLTYYLPGHPVVFLTGSAGFPRIPSYDARDAAALPGQNGLYVIKDGFYAVQDVRRSFRSLTLLATVDRAWGGKVVDHYEIWLAESYGSGTFENK
ncbi:4-amino-4-deoxy-L-arabinose transferase and related glycosyltransferase of PMT family [Paramagnetospirillum magneticum AMB-1]|uniref:4-amino-4-deoxy-L-arabinose transferase and related glycosyltransferase of PMT family n=1 Tax=Paramagnetospirillum magneticum (strain ATCC 700264 / AMB-1) TaxID=342108 RepID=Q2W9Z2_PARM1|nr:4-amino-4-deoxy-L-arabinose transferase and related glycosyltransferase of PMT family [Paramagnetospirillum magneticum AMB-1]